MIPRDIMESYNLICNGLVAGLRGLGLKAEFKPRVHRCPDIVVGGRKISGNAQTRRKGTILQHGTVLLQIDLERMFSLLKTPGCMDQGEMIEKAREKLTSIDKELGNEVPIRKVYRALVRGFEEVLGEEIIPGDLNEYEESLKRNLTAKYRSEEWTFKFFIMQ